MILVITAIHSVYTNCRMINSLFLLSEIHDIQAAISKIIIYKIIYKIHLTMLGEKILELIIW